MSGDFTQLAPDMFPARHKSVWLSSAVEMGPIGSRLYHGCYCQLWVSSCSAHGVLRVSGIPSLSESEGIAVDCNFTLQLWWSSTVVERLT